MKKSDLREERHDALSRYWVEKMLPIDEKKRRGEPLTPEEEDILSLKTYAQGASGPWLLSISDSPRKWKAHGKTSPVRREIEISPGSEEQMISSLRHELGHVKFHAQGGMGELGGKEGDEDDVLAELIAYYYALLLDPEDRETRNELALYKQVAKEIYRYKPDDLRRLSNKAKTIVGYGKKER